MISWGVNLFFYYVLLLYVVVIQAKLCDRCLCSCFSFFHTMSMEVVSYNEMIRMISNRIIPTNDVLSIYLLTTVVVVSVSFLVKRTTMTRHLIIDWRCWHCWHHPHDCSHSTLFFRCVLSFASSSFQVVLISVSWVWQHSDLVNPPMMIIANVMILWNVSSWVSCIRITCPHPSVPDCDCPSCT